jgi:hypothetical protein
MSRSGYSDDCGGWDLIRWRGAVNAAIKGARGQALLRELLAGLDAMPVKELVADEFAADGCMCALGVVGAARGMDLSKLDIEDRESVAKAFGIATALAAEVMDVNDNGGNRWGRYHANIKTTAEMDEADRRDREKRWHDVRSWVAASLLSAQGQDAAAIRKLGAQE